jgi:lipopolysaccharide export system protein LptA
MTPRKLLPAVALVLGLGLGLDLGAADARAAQPAAAPPAGAAPAASGLPAMAGDGNNRQPVNILADNAIEWHQDQKAYVARGNASAKRGDTTVYADVLTAYYRETKDKGTEIHRMTAEGNVRVVSPNQQVFGDHGVYDIDQQVAVVTGKGLRLITPNEVVTARDSLEYFEATRLAVARGDALAVRKDDRIRADTLVGRFKEGKAGALELERIDGDGHVVITSPTDVALCRRVMYSVASDIAILTGDVKITRNDNQVNGDAAEMNMKTHVSRVLGGGRRVEGLIIPQQAEQNKPGQAGQPGQPAKAAKPARST